jgi:hypothetical protein
VESLTARIEGPEARAGSHVAELAPSQRSSDPNSVRSQEKQWPAVGCGAVPERTTGRYTQAGSGTGFKGACLALYGRCVRRTALLAASRNRCAGNSGRWHAFRGPLALGVALGALVCFPFFGRGWLLLLDWSMGPHPTLVPPAAHGLAGGLVAGLPLYMILVVASHGVGGAVTWLPIVLFFPVAVFSIGRLVPGRQVAGLSAGLLYCVNPFVFDRIAAGHIGFLTGYAVLPLAVASIVQAPDRRSARRLDPVLWIAILAGCSIHFVWIAAVVVLVVVIQRRLAPRILGWAALVGVGVVATTLYVLVSPASGHSGVHVGAADLAAYRTTGDPRLGLFFNVAGLYGFWRRGEVLLPKDSVSGWPFLALALLIVIGLGAKEALRRPERPLAIVLMGSGALGYFLALGDQGPTGPLFRWAYFHVPGFDVMREPQKFLCLLALAYAVLFGWGVESLLVDRRRWAGRAAVALTLALPLAYTPTIFGALNGQIQLSKVPPSWAEADRTMGTGSGNVLFLPWHLYMAFPFTGGRVIANPAPAMFRRPVISGDDVELATIRTESTSPRSAFLEYVFAHGNEVRAFGALVAPLDVKYVVLAKTVDWQTYSWLDHQPDLSLVLDTPAIEVWRNDVPVAVGRRVTATELGRSWASLVAQPPVAAIPSEQVIKRSPVAYDVSAGAPGWVELAEPYDSGWALRGEPGKLLPEGNLGWQIGSGPTAVKYRPWSRVRLGYLVSAMACIALIGARLCIKQRPLT